ncbi:hypothetical protein PILCRDRAFT_92025 [Piloderma croceum F 1598]|uniref:Uncharacterized protein n=1 Tax=Piloderma croceum (strain F 1598) TaxID=765440 RepID=A0A0C3ANU0_PILCF|nr:hypothetical protein PILCRDRAFT_92025 [Piloderma croceum F 1598]
MNDTNLECHQSGSDAVLNAAMIIFVQNDKDIAAALSGTHLLVVQTQHRASSGEAPLHITSIQPLVEINVLHLPYGGCCILVDKGRSLLPSIPLQGDDLWDHYCDKLKVDSTANHIATREDYLERYHFIPAQKQLGYQSYFSKYLVVQCWNKMHQQITDWSSQGFIWQLSRISETQLQDTFSQYAMKPDLSEFTTKWYNFALGALVVGLEDMGQIESVITKPCGRSEFHSECLTNLIAAFREAWVQGASQPQDDGLGVYGKYTCVEFHRLFIAMLLSYGQHLEALQHTDKMNGIDQAQKYEQHHHRVLRWGVFLTLPINDDEDIIWYNNYTGFTTCGCLDIPKAESGCNTSEAAVREYQRTFKESSMYMEKCPHLGRELQVEPWRNTVQDLLASASSAKPLNADSVIKIISHHIDVTKNKVNINPIFKIFRTATNHITFKSSTHCKALLTSLIKYAKDAPMANNDSLRALLQVPVVLSIPTKQL